MDKIQEAKTTKTTKYNLSRIPLLWHFLLIGLGIGMFTFPRQVLLTKYSYLTVNDKYITGSTGFINKTNQNSPISQITSIRVDQSLLGRLLNYGNIYISTAKGDYYYRYMENPEIIKNHILSLI
ncbi:MAG: PH domain-containing protein [Tissierellia bacterium]|nr:PH domain-containing protein [Tissierellia bacterium]